MSPDHAIMTLSEVQSFHNYVSIRRVRERESNKSCKECNNSISFDQVKKKRNKLKWKNSKNKKKIIVKANKELDIFPVSFELFCCSLKCFSKIRHLIKKSNTSRKSKYFPTQTTEASYFRYTTYSFFESFFCLFVFFVSFFFSVRFWPMIRSKRISNVER